MKRLTYAIILSLFPCIAVMAQGPPPPPPPLIYSAPTKDEIKEFTSKEFRFKASFPGEPKRAESLDNNPKVVEFKVYRKGSKSIVGIATYKKNTKDNVEEIVKFYKNGILNLPPPYPGAKLPRPNIISEETLKIEGYKAIEIIYEYDLSYAKVRLIFVGKNVYELRTDVTNWHILTKYNKDKVEEFQKESQRFFESFKLIK